MKLIKPSFEVIDQQAGLDGIYRQIELAGRTCYKSENLITETSAKEFVDRMIASGHGAMLEHGTIYLTIDPNKCKQPECTKIQARYTQSKYSKVVNKWFYEVENNIRTGKPYAYITTNLRVIIENGWLDDLQYICEPTEHHEKRTTVKFICDRGILCEFTRHRVFSFAAESTRYCNYSKDKFGNDITFIIPNWLDSLQLGEHNSLKICNEYYDIPLEREFESQELQELTYLWSLATSEIAYLKLIETGWQPQQARSVLPNSLKTELVMTGFVSDWEHFFKLRCAQSAHPQARELAVPLEEYFKQNNIL